MLPLSCCPNPYLAFLVPISLSSSYLALSRCSPIPFLAFLAVLIPILLMLLPYPYLPLLLLLFLSDLAKVVKGTYDSHPVAVKLFRKYQSAESLSRQYKSLREEVTILSHLDHPR